MSGRPQGREWQGSSQGPSHPLPGAGQPGARGKSQPQGIRHLPGDRPPARRGGGADIIRPIKPLRLKTHAVFPQEDGSLALPACKIKLCEVVIPLVFKILQSII